MQIWPSRQNVKGHSRTVSWTNLVGLEYPILYKKIELHSFLGYGEDIQMFQMFFSPYMGMVAISFNGVEPFEQVIIIPSTEGPMWNLVKIGQAVSEKNRRLKITRIYRCI